MTHEPFLLAKITEAYIWKKGKLTSLELFIKKPFITAGELDDKGMSKNAWLKLITVGKNPGRKFLNQQLNKLEKAKDDQKLRIATTDFPLRWAGAGGLLILNLPDGKKLVPVIKRASFGQHPGKLDLPGGMSGKLADLLYPEKLAKKEIGEEIIISFGKKRHEDNELKNITGKFSTHRLVIRYQNRIFNYEGICCLDSANAAIDTRNLFSLNLRDNNFTIADGETYFDKNRRPFFMHRKIYLIEYRDLFRIPDGKITPAFRAVLKTIKKNDKRF